MAESKGNSRNFFETNEVIHRFSGLWVFDRGETPTRWKIAQNAYSSFSYGINICFILLEIIMFKETAKEVGKFIKHFDMLLSTVSIFMKVAALRLQHKRLLRIMDILQDKVYFFKPVDEFDPEKVYLNEKRHSQLVSILLIGFYSFVGVLGCISSKQAMDVRVKETHFAPNTSCHDFLPYYFYIPFCCDTKKKCEGVMIFMMVSLVFCGWILSGHDGMYGALVNCLKTNFDILAGAIRTIRKRVMIALKLPEDLEVFNDEDMPILEEALYAELRNLIKHLITLLEVADELEAAFNLDLLGQVIISLVSFPCVLFVAASSPIASAEFFSQFEYFICLLIQLSVFCWYGDIIRTSSEDILYALYDCDWFGSSRRFKSTLVLTMCRMQKPVSLTFGKFCPLTINTLVSVCKSSFSYFTVFKSVSK